MKRRDYSESYEISETGNWNVAMDYSKYKIMKPLANCDIYENIAEFGYDTLNEELVNWGVPTDNLRLMGFKRLVKELLKLIKNSKFALKKKGTKEEIEKYETSLEKVLKIIPTLSKKIVNQRTNQVTIKIKEEEFSKVLDVVLKIKSSINKPLNKNHLIYTDKDEFDPTAFKKETIKRFIEGM